MLNSTFAPDSQIDLEFAPSARQTGYYCVENALPTPSSKWLYRSDDGGMTWRQLGSLGSIVMPKVFEPGPFGCNVFVDAHDPNDVFVEMTIPTGCSGQGPCQGANANSLWRSRDGGTTWSQLKLPRATVVTTGELNSLIVSDSRLIGLEGDVLQQPTECTTDPNASIGLHLNDLVASDDSGRTWHTIGQSIYNQGLSISQESGRSGGQLLQNDGSSIVVHASCEAPGSTGVSSRDSDWISSDDGSTWNQVSVVHGGSDMESFTYTPHVSSGIYGVAVALSSGTYGVAVDYGPGYTTLPIVRYSTDSGASWRSLPSLSAIPDARTTGAEVSVYWVLPMPDGSVLACIVVGTLGANGQTLSSAIYAIAPQSANPTWQRFSSKNITVLAERYGSMPVSETAQGLALWGSSFDYQTNAGVYSYLTPLP
jgi:hypothetical protein